MVTRLPLYWLAAVGLAVTGCAPVDAVDADAAVTPPGAADAAPDAAPDERCTPSDSSSVPTDDDGDGAIDEGCAWHFGNPHWLPPVDGTASAPRLVYPAWLSPDGKRLYLVSVAGGSSRVMVMTRTGRDAPFGPAVDVRGTALPNWAVVAITLSDDEREAFVSARAAGSDDDTDLYRMVRAEVGADFGDLAPLPHLSTGGGEEGVTLSADGLELMYAADRRLYRALRSAPRGVFGPPEAVVGIPDTAVNSPQLSRDRRTLFFYRPPAGRPFRIFRADRADPATAIFGDPVEVAELEPSGQNHVFHPLLAEGTREMFMGSDQAWSPTRYAIWRAELCRDGPCSPQLVACTGVRSPDGQHCYSTLAALQTQAEAEAACRTAGGHLASITSAAEQALVWTAFGRVDLWFGGFDDRAPTPECNVRALDGSSAWPCPWSWESGERWSYSAWGQPASELGVEPQEVGEEDCAAMLTGYAGLWADIPCSRQFGAVCETTRYPTW